MFFSFYYKPRRKRERNNIKRENVGFLERERFKKNPFSSKENVRICL
ncbi:hypothetical protein D920_00564 [Enterococcus faecalis 13-SD-W-01]|nr:hypothetical protein D920_00564 [Enterococcus faecalis 13-SD-W-01]